MQHGLQQEQDPDNQLSYVTIRNRFSDPRLESVFREDTGISFPKICRERHRIHCRRHEPRDLPVDIDQRSQIVRMRPTDRSMVPRKRDIR